MDQASFLKLLDWLSYHGINSLEELVMCYSSHDPSYAVNDNTHYLDGWIYANLSSICRFAIMSLQEHNLFLVNKHWLNFKSIHDFEQHGFKINLPPSTQVKVVPSFRPCQAPAMGSTKSNTVQTKSSPAFPRTLVQQIPKISTKDHLKRNIHPIPSSTQVPSKMAVKVPAATSVSRVPLHDSIQVPTMGSPKADTVPRLPKNPAIIPSSSQTRPVKNLVIKKPTVKDNKPVVVTQAPVATTHPVRVLPSLPTHGQLLPDPPMVKAKPEDALTRFTQRPSYKGFLTDLLKSTCNNPIPPKEILQVDRSPTSSNGECVQQPVSPSTTNLDDNSMKCLQQEDLHPSTEVTMD